MVSTLFTNWQKDIKARMGAFKQNMPLFLYKLYNIYRSLIVQSVQLLSVLGWANAIKMPDQHKK